AATAAAPSGVMQASATTVSPQAPENLPLRASQPPSPTNPGAVPPLNPVPPAADPANPMARMRELYQRAAEKHAAMDSYVLRLRRREVVGTQSRPEEILLMKWRRQPWSIYLKWQGTEGKGREVIYVKGRYEDKLHTLTAAGDIPLMPAGKRLSLAPDGPLVRSKSRYPITEAGLGSLIERYGRLIEAVEKGDMRQGTVKYLGLVKRDDYDKQLDGVLQTIPPASDPHLPRGGARLWFFDPTLNLPMLLITKDETNREVEYYCHDRFMYPVNLTDDDFNPDVLWKTPGTH
ncbi:MAG: hypothetical protein C5B58_06360, partial [Acidobacteria bacterium]